MESKKGSSTIMSVKDRKYIHTRPLIVLKPFDTNIEPAHFYLAIKEALNVFPRFSSKVVSRGEELFFEYEENYFRFNALKSNRIDVLDNFRESNFNFQVFEGLTDDFISSLDQPLTGFTLTNFPNEKSILSFSVSHAIGDALAIKIFILKIAEAMKNQSSLLSHNHRQLMDWKKHSHQRHGTVRDINVAWQYLPNNIVEKVEENYNKQNLDLVCTKVDIVSSIIIKNTSKQLAFDTEILRFKIPIDVRRKVKAEKSFIGNAYQSTLFEWSKQEIDSLSLFDIIYQVHEKINTLKKFQSKGFLNEATKTALTNGKDQKEYIIGFLGNLSRVYNAFGDNSLKTMLTVSSDPYSFAVHRTSSGYNIQSFSSNETL